MLTAIVGILLGNLLVATLFAPALKELREILVKFDGISLPFRPLFALQQIPQADRQKAQDKATLEFNRLFRQYAMSFNAFRKVGLIFLGSIVVPGRSCRVAVVMGVAAICPIIARFCGTCFLRWSVPSKGDSAHASRTRINRFHAE